ncbi:Ras guanine nucleotide exchange factor [Cavenderia fasciculata]|uniref:Ras guanine nucleotide exchange factor n=1 Tax=Cavenderia fasciculata TaxID=261658 RepID=F4Q8C4_CACFS|nr:Ras guanine nucleotide exchange factor [Cavenderia fasciculata]EGG16024.1 Ras guanine nucleotide exchange factor [Cavenderia fasciculata]|eukprot:XP_004352349.1 Ras guanine nucleotide exchange factor [Cavenderia fasciculata]
MTMILKLKHFQTPPFLAVKEKIVVKFDSSCSRLKEKEEQEEEEDEEVELVSFLRDKEKANQLQKQQQDNIYYNNNQNNNYNNNTSMMMINHSHHNGSGSGVININIGTNNNDSRELEILDLSRQRLREIPYFPDYASLRTLIACDNLVSQLTVAFIEGTPNLQVVDLSANTLASLPEEIYLWASVTVLRLDKNYLTELPQSLSRMPLEQLSVSNNQLTHIPNFTHMPNLRYLCISQNSLLSASVHRIYSYLYPSSSPHTLLRGFSSTPSSLMDHLSGIHANTNNNNNNNNINNANTNTTTGILHHPSTMTTASIFIREERASGNGGSSSSSPSNLTSPLMVNQPTHQQQQQQQQQYSGGGRYLTTTNTGGGPTSKLPTQTTSINVSPLHSPTHSEHNSLNMKKNYIVTIPSDIQKLIKLKRLDLSNNAITHLPEALSNLKCLSSINVGNNKLGTSNTIEYLARIDSLTKINLKSNLIVHFPTSLLSLSKLSSLYLDSNEISILPELKSCKSLTDFTIENNKLINEPLSPHFNQESLYIYNPIHTPLSQSQHSSSQNTSSGNLMNIKDMVITTATTTSTPTIITPKGIITTTTCKITTPVVIHPSIVVVETTPSSLSNSIVNSPSSSNNALSTPTSPLSISKKPPKPLPVVPNNSHHSSSTLRGNNNNNYGGNLTKSSTTPSLSEKPIVPPLKLKPLDESQPMFFCSPSQQLNSGNSGSSKSGGGSVSGLSGCRVRSFTSYDYPTSIDSSRAKDGGRDISSQDLAMSHYEGGFLERTMSSSSDGEFPWPSDEIDGGGGITSSTSIGSGLANSTSGHFIGTQKVTSPNTERTRPRSFTKFTSDIFSRAKHSIKSNSKKEKEKDSTSSSSNKFNSIFTPRRDREKEKDRDRDLTTTLAPMSPHAFIKSDDNSSNNGLVISSPSTPRHGFPSFERNGSHPSIKRDNSTLSSLDHDHHHVGNYSHNNSIDDFSTMIPHHGNNNNNTNNRYSDEFTSPPISQSMPVCGQSLLEKSMSNQDEEMMLFGCGGQNNTTPQLLNASSVNIQHNAPNTSRVYLKSPSIEGNGSGSNSNNSSTVGSPAAGNNNNSNNNNQQVSGMRIKMEFVDEIYDDKNQPVSYWKKRLSGLVNANGQMNKSSTNLLTPNSKSGSDRSSGLQSSISSSSVQQQQQYNQYAAQPKVKKSKDLNVGSLQYGSLLSTSQSNLSSFLGSTVAAGDNANNPSIGGGVSPSSYAGSNPLAASTSSIPYNNNNGGGGNGGGGGIGYMLKESTSNTNLNSNLDGDDFIRDLMSSYVINQDIEFTSEEGVPKIKTASLKMLVNLLTHEKGQSKDLENCFFDTYKLFTNVESIVALLQERFYQTAKGTGNASLIKLKVIRFVHRWVDRNWDDFLDNSPTTDEPYTTRLKDFVKVCQDTVEKGFSASFSLKTELSNLAKFTDIKSDPDYFDDGSMGEWEQPPPIPDFQFQETLVLLDLKSHEIARQLTMIDHSLLHKITKRELLDYCQSQSNPPQSIVAVTNRFNFISRWVASEITSCTTVEKRVSLIFKFINIALNCWYLKNFNSTTAIIAGMKHGAVCRFKTTWYYVNQTKAGIVFQELEEMISPTSIAKFRKIQDSVEPPSVPYLGSYFNHLIGIGEGNKSVNSNDQINLIKYEMIGKILSKLHAFQEKKYNLTTVGVLQNFLNNGLQWDENQLYSAAGNRDEKVDSQLLEPNGKFSLVNDSTCYILSQ